MPKRNQREDLVGRVFGRLTVERFDPKSPPRKTQFICLCSCGTRVSVNAWRLKNMTQSCGCYRSELLKQRNRDNATHGQSRSPEYNLYRSMIGRCYYQGAGNYQYYGARGIRICKRWLGPKGFENFYADMGPRPSKTHSVERKKTDQNYKPSNCYWATPEQQAQNKRTTVRITFEGEQMSMRKACRLAGKPYATILQRVGRGWSIRRAFDTPVGTNARLAARKKSCV